MSVNQTNHRVSRLLSQLSANNSAVSNSVHSNSTSGSNSNGSNLSDIVIVSAIRTPITKARKGGLKDTMLEELLTTVIKGTLQKTNINPKDIGDIVVGTVLGQGSQRANECRIAALLAGVPHTVPIQTLNRQCSSGLQSIATVASSIQSGYYSMGLACGVESMSNSAFNWEGSFNAKVFLNPEAKDCLLPMGITSENVAKQYKISRKEQDEFAVESNKRAAKAIAEGKFKEQIIPVVTKIKDPKTGQTKAITVDTDDGVRGDTTFEGLSKLKPAFDPKGSTTAGNASQVSDGAAAVLLCSRDYAIKHKLPILAKFVNFAVTGVPPRIMGVGPITAIESVLSRSGLNKSDIDVFEINEAFASQAVASIKTLGLDPKKVNPNGGAIALGHPLGCTGARQTADIIQELKRQNGRYGIVSMCIGSGMGAAGLFELEK